MSLLERLANAHIEVAAERGELDDLPGAGKPLALDDDRHVPADLRARYCLLKNAGFVPPEIQTGRAIRDVRDLLAVAAPNSAEAEHLTRRLRWLETRLGSSRRGRALLADSDYGGAIRQRLAHTDNNTDNTGGP